MSQGVDSLVRLNATCMESFHVKVGVQLVRGRSGMSSLSFTATCVHGLCNRLAISTLHKGYL